MKPYKDQRLTWDQNTLRDEEGQAVMMDWEAPIMKLGASTICQNGGRVLNIGFGMGLIDGYIQQENIDEHWIIEMHPDVLQYMRDHGWYDKSNVRILEGPWQEHLETLPEFDGIYFDTWDESGIKLLKEVHKYLKPDGIFSFFNNVQKHERGGVNLHVYNLLNQWGEIEITETIELDQVADSADQNIKGSFYWNPACKTYNNPKVTKRCN